MTIEEEIADSIARIRRESAAGGGHPPEDLEDRVRALITYQRAEAEIRRIKEAFGLSPYASKEEMMRVIQRFKREIEEQKTTIERLEKELANVGRW